MFIVLLLLLIITDQLSKYYISHTFELYQSVPIISNVLNLTYIKNAGAAFGILQNFRLLFIIVTSIILITISFYYIISPENSKILRLSLILILAGGVGNLIDRIRFGYVIDFIDTRIWPVFNLADSMVCVGSILLLYFTLFKYKQGEKHGTN